MKCFSSAVSLLSLNKVDILRKGSFMKYLSTAFMKLIRSLLLNIEFIQMEQFAENTIQTCDFRLLKIILGCPEFYIPCGFLFAHFTIFSHFVV